MIDPVRQLIFRAAGGGAAHLAELVRGASKAFGVKVIAAAVSFAFNVLIARMLGADGAGIYFLALTVFLVGVRVGTLGLDVPLLRFTAANSITGQWDRVRGVYLLGMRYALPASVLVSATIFLSAPWLADTLFAKPDLRGPLRWMSLAVYPFVLGLLHAELLRGLKRIVSSQALMSLGLPVFAAGGVLLLAPRHGVVGAVWAYGLASTAAAMVGVVLWNRAAPELRGIRGRFPSAELFDSAMPALWIGLLQFIVNWTSTLVLGVYASEAEVGIYNVAARTAVLTTFVLVAVNSIAAPQFAALYRHGDLDALERTAKGATALMVVTAAPVLAAFILAPAPILSLFGEEFRQGALALTVLGVGQFISVATGTVSCLLTMSGHEREMRNILIFITVVNGALNLALVPALGVVGAAFATAISLAAQSLLALFLVHRRLGIVTIPSLRGDDGSESHG